MPGKWHDKNTTRVLRCLAVSMRSFGYILSNLFKRSFVWWGGGPELPRQALPPAPPACALVRAALLSWEPGNGTETSGVSQEHRQSSATWPVGYLETDATLKIHQDEWVAYNFPVILLLRRVFSSEHYTLTINNHSTYLRPWFRIYTLITSKLFN